VKRDSSTLASELFAHDGPSDPDQPGLVMVFSANRPTCVPTRLMSETVTIGRTSQSAICLALDARVSRSHASLRLKGGLLEVIDHGSRNGTYLDGKRVDGTVITSLPRTLRTGDTLFVIVPRIARFSKANVEVVDGVVVGPTLAAVRRKLAQMAAGARHVLLSGPTGAGKELAARYFHASGRSPSGPFIAVNCATIPSNLAERLLFGTRRGAYSGADAHVDGFIQAAHGGTLFLDEIAELEPSVQAKLLRVLETHEVLALGATRPEKVDFQTCAATLKDLRVEVAAGRFREDLYHRIGRPEIRIPSLIERAEEMPWLAVSELRRQDERLSPSASFLEACLLRDWPGNIREFLQDIQEAALHAKSEDCLQLGLAHLTEVDNSISVTHSSQGFGGNRSTAPDNSRIMYVLQAVDGNISKAARTLGMHRNSLRRWVISNGVDVATLRDPARAGSVRAAADVNSTVSELVSRRE
jgi:transcriptional regulator of acetoin/glycerol metabolism